MKIIMIGALPESLINFRGKLLQQMSESGFTVIAMAHSKNASIAEQLKKINVRYQHFIIKRNGLNPIIDFKTWFALYRYFKKENPDVIFAYTIKPIIWGGLASRFRTNTRFYALITGLGFAFQEGNFIRNSLVKLVTNLYKIALKNADKVIFQNPDNLQVFVKKGIIDRNRCELVNGSGVDTLAFNYTSLPDSTETIFLTIGRLLGDKGFREYAQAAEIVRNKHPQTKFLLQGPTDPSPDGITLAEVETWEKTGNIEYLGATSDVRPSIRSCHIFVLPSYHEGMPRTVLEAMAIGRPIITTDVSGCRETVINGENGYLVPKADANALAERMIWFIENQTQWERMGKRSRELAEEKYDVHKVNAQLMEIMGL